MFGAWCARPLTGGSAPRSVGLRLPPRAQGIFGQAPGARGVRSGTQSQGGLRISRWASGDVRRRNRTRNRRQRRHRTLLRDHSNRDQPTFAAANKALDIDEQDDLRVNVDVAVIDTGIDQTHPDLNVVARANCMLGGETCTNNSGTDGNSHGTHVAGTIGAIDNSYGVVGTAPGARLWAVKVLNDSGGGTFSTAAAGVDWVTAHASEIEVANMSLGGSATTVVLREAVEASIKAGVVYVVAAGNSATTPNSSPPQTSNLPLPSPL